MKRKKGVYACGYTSEEIFKDEEERTRVYNLSEVDKELFITNKIEELNRTKEVQSLYLAKEKSKTNFKDSDNSDRHLSDGEVRGEEDLSIDNLSPERRHSRSRSRSRSNSSLHSDTESLSNSEEDKKSKTKAKSIMITLPEIESVKITRQFCEKYWDLPIFNDNIKDTFVRINMYSSKLNSHSSSNSNSTGYCLGQIIEIKENKAKPYTFNSKQCYKYINVKHANQEKQFTFQVISNSSINESEFNQWKKHMEENSLAFPTEEVIKAINENILKITNFKYSDEQLNEIIIKRKKEKIKNKDKNINITYELKILNERYNASIAKYEETKDEKYLKMAKSVQPEIESLEKMKEEKEKQVNLIAMKDRGSNINKKNIEKQRIEDLKHSLLNKKTERNENDMFNPFKRKNCLPMNLYESGCLNDDSKPNEEEKKEDKKEENKNENDNEQEAEADKKEPECYGVVLFKQMQSIQKKIKGFGSVLEEMIEKDKKVNEDKKKKGEDTFVDFDMFFSLANINANKFNEYIKEANKAVNVDGKAKKLTLEDF